MAGDVTTTDAKTKMYGLKVKLPDLRDEASRVKIDTEDYHMHPEPRASIITKMGGSVMHTYANDAFPSTSPRIRLRIDPTHLYCDLLVQEDTMENALQWKITRWNENAFRQFAERAVDLALRRWANEEFDLVVYADDQNIYVRDE